MNRKKTVKTMLAAAFIFFIGWFAGSWVTNSEYQRKALLDEQQQPITLPSIAAVAEQPSDIKPLQFYMGNIDHMRETLWVLQSLYCENLTKDECSAKSEKDASRISGETWDRYLVLKEKSKYRANSAQSKISQ